MTQFVGRQLSRGCDAQLGVRFDENIPGGISLGGRCADGYGMFCNAADLVLEAEPVAGAERPDEVQANVAQLFAAVEELASEQPLVVFIKVRLRPFTSSHMKG